MTGRMEKNIPHPNLVWIIGIQLGSTILPVLPFQTLIPDEKDGITTTVTLLILVLLVLTTTRLTIIFANGSSGILIIAQIRPIGIGKAVGRRAQRRK